MKLIKTLVVIIPVLLSVSGCAHLGALETILKHSHKAVKEHIKTQDTQAQVKKNKSKEVKQTAAK